MDIPATLDITFDSYYVGDHRICYRIVGDPSYDCTTEVTCTGGGATCSASISILIDHESCDPVTYQGYVQAMCHAIGSLDGRVIFSITFTPTQPCTSYMVRCNESEIESITITDPGSDYDPLNPPAVNALGGGGSGETLTAIVGDEGVKTWTITDAGTAYTTDATYNNKPAVAVTGAALTLVDGTPVSGTTYSAGTYGVVGGTGTGMTVDITVGAGIVLTAVINNGGHGYTASDAVVIDDPGRTIDCTITLATVGPTTPARFNVTVAGNVVTALVLVTTLSTAPGAGYGVGDTFSFLDADLGGNTGTPCLITVDSVNTGEIQWVTVVDGGSGFTAAPTISIDPSIGDLAVLTPVMMNCDKFDIVQCDDSTSDLFEMALGQEIIICIPSDEIVSVPTGYTAVLAGCCYDCVEVQFDPNGEVDPVMTYTDCTTKQITELVLTGGVETVCVLNNSWYVTPADANVIVTVGAACVPIIP